MKTFSIINIPPLSFFSKDLYRDVAMNWRGVNFSYLLLLLAICWIPRVFRIDKQVSWFIKTEVPPVVSQIPEITITNGEVSIAEPQPYYIKMPQNNKVLAIIDTAGTITSLDNTDATILVTKNNVMARENPRQTRTFSLAGVKNFVITQNKVTQWIHIFKKVVIVAMYPIAVLGSFIFRIIQALVYAAIGLLFASWCRVTLKYESLIRLAVVALTPSIILKTIIVSAGAQLPLAYLIYLLLALAYLYFGVKAVSDVTAVRQEGQPPEEPGAV